VEIFQIAAAIGGLVFLAVSLTLYALFKQRVDLGHRLQQKSSQRPSESGMQVIGKRLEKTFKPLGEMLPRSPEEMSRQENRMVQAGFRRKDAVVLFYSAQITLAISTAVIFTAGGYMSQRPFLCLVLSLFLGAALPDTWLKNRTVKRQTEIRHGLPDAMDLALVAVEAGLGLDQALLRVGDDIREAYPDLSDELRLRNLEVNLGKTRSEALRNFAERTGVEDVKTLVAILVQTDRFGTSVGQALRTFSDSLRTKRRQRAEEQAAKLAIKMIIPMAIFIFPAVFVVILGPPFIAIVRDLLPLLAGQ
jgi:tight adherence protein C